MTMKPRRIELLSPAKDLACGLAAVNYGADAVYIGAPRFGARAAAGNTLDDIRQLIDHAHPFGVRIYVTVNTILYDDELDEAEELIWQLYRLGADALIVQDTALLRMNLPPIPLHASTQMDNRTPEKVKLLKELGFSQTVLARELSLQEIAAIHAAVPDMPLEAFVHGALCVSYSGQCYASQHCFGRSANRGECAQFCRLPFSLEDAEGNTIIRNHHLLSLKDMNRLDSLEEMLDAGITALKIEGRLKDAAYVKNITSCYRQKLDEIFARRPEYIPASRGTVEYNFTPSPQKSFNRGFTEYFLHGRTDDIGSFNTPKSVGEPMGRVSFIGKDYFSVKTETAFHNGDGVCAFADDGTLMGFRINRVESGRLYPSPESRNVDWRSLKGKMLYRNYDAEFEKNLTRPDTASRFLPVRITLKEIPFGFAVALEEVEGGMSAECCFPMAKEAANTPQTDNIRRQLSKLGGTICRAADVQVEWSREWFIPSSMLADMRRKTVETFLLALRLNGSINPSTERREQRSTSNSTEPREQNSTSKQVEHKLVDLQLSYRGNVANRKAETFYRDLGAKKVEPAFEIKPPTHAVLMTCRHCLRYSLGFCPKHQQRHTTYKEPLFLISADGRRFPLRFDCKRCVMEVLN